MNDLPYELAPSGSPDKYVLTKDVFFKWKNPPDWIMKVFMSGYRDCIIAKGYLWRSHEFNGMVCKINAGHFFSVSVAPDTEKTMGGSCLHDFLYENAAEFAKFYGISVRLFLHIADHWFLANLRASDFLFARTYFIGVRAFGYGFNRLFKFNKAITQ